MARILISGSLAYDRIMNFNGRFEEHLFPEMKHALSVSFLVEDLKESYGGTAGNIAYNTTLLEEKVAILASAGNDFEPYQKWLNQNNIDTTSIQIDIGERTAFATILTDQKNNQIAAFYPGAMRKPSHALGHSLETKLAIIGAGNVEDMQNLPSLFRASKTPFIFDPAQQIPSLSADDLKNGIEGSRALISNDYELALIMNKTGWSEDELLGHTEMLVTTFGGEGSHIRTHKEQIKIPAAQPKNINDPTGAGDAYRAGFIVGLMNNWPLEAAGKLGATVACYTVEAYGTQTHWFSKEQVHERYKENFGEYPPTW